MSTASVGRVGNVARSEGASAAPWGRCVICREPILTSYVDVPARDGSYSVRAHDSCFRKQQEAAAQAELAEAWCAICHKPLAGYVSEVPSADGELGMLVHLGCWQRRQAELTAGVEVEA